MKRLRVELVVLFISLLLLIWGAVGLLRGSGDPAADSSAVITATHSIAWPTVAAP